MMKKYSLLFCISLLFPAQSLAQNRGYVALSMGAAIPINYFGSKDVNNTTGLAIPGGNLDVSFAYKLGKYFGFAGLFRGQLNGFDSDVILGKPEKYSSVEVSQYVLLFAMGGIYGSFPITEKLAFETRALMGIMNANSPEINISEPGNWQKRGSVSALSSAFLLGAGLKYDFTTTNCLLFNLDYTTAKPEFRDVETTYGSTNRIDYTTYRLSIQSINLSVGIGIKI